MSCATVINWWKYVPKTDWIQLRKMFEWPNPIEIALQINKPNFLYYQTAIYIYIYVTRVGFMLYVFQSQIHLKSRVLLPVTCTVYLFWYHAFLNTACNAIYFLSEQRLLLSLVLKTCWFQYVIDWMSTHWSDDLLHCNTNIWY